MDVDLREFNRELFVCSLDETDELEEDSDGRTLNASSLVVKSLVTVAENGNLILSTV